MPPLRETGYSSGVTHPQDADAYRANGRRYRRGTRYGDDTTTRWGLTRENPAIAGLFRSG